MDIRRREFLEFAAVGLAEAGASAGWACRSLVGNAVGRAPFDVRSFGAAADGKTLATPAVNRAIAAAAAAGGGTVRLPAGTYVCHSIRLKSFVSLYFDPSSTVRGSRRGISH